MSLDLICKFDLAGRFLLVSDSCLPMLGYSVDELMGRNYLDFVHPDDRARTIAASAGLLASSKLTEFENRIIHKKGSAINLLWATAWDAATHTTHSIGRDVTHLREAEAALAEEKKTVAALQGLLSVCAWCNNIRNENDDREKLEHYAQRHADVQVSHGMCPTCLKKHYPEN
ncbi:MAG: PAS domain-containing protein [Tahibacter sp.]